MSPEDPLATERHEFLRVLSLAASESGQFGIALDAAEELARESASHQEAVPALNAAFALAACFERMGDSWQAMRLLREALRHHGDQAAGLPRLVALNGLAAIAIGAFHRLDGAATAAEVAIVLDHARSAAEQARMALAALPNPLYEVVVLGNLGEILMYQGDLAGAEPLLRHALELAGLRGLRAHGFRVRASLGAWLVAMQRHAEARRLLEALIDELGERGPPQSRLRARHAAYRACRALGDLEAALDHFERYEQLERLRATSQLRAQSELFVTRAEAQRAQWEAAQAQAEAARQREQAQAATERAERDPLTGLGNRHLLERRFGELLPAAEQQRQPFAVVLLDLDHFKRVNDRHGHAGGDAVLAAIGALLRESTRAGDVLARLGGEEFVLLLPGLAPLHAVDLCERLRERIAHQAWPGLPEAERITASLGLAHAAPYDAGELLRRADAALYQAKRSGRDRLCEAA
jgi:diguanylate cyclase (GGDEF)-like protein